jgi:clan AA aspartic protease (TIGR02281 family)
MMNKEGGVYTVPCKINGLPLKFIFDTGASDVSISLTEAIFMLKNGYLDKEDIGEDIYFSIANGDVSKGTKINIKEVEFGGLKLYNVSASIVHETSAPLLLGQSIIEKLGKIQIDGRELTILNYGNNIYNYSNQKETIANNNIIKWNPSEPDKFLYMKYKRLQREINASHILVSLGTNPTKVEITEAYNKCLKARNRILNGEKFEAIAVEISEDPSVKNNLGYLGYFSAFKMVAEFEDEAYLTRINEISMPVRTRFGYHIIKVNDIRDNKGEILIAHIMILNNNPNAKSTIDDIYSKLQQGENFDTLAKQFSEDKSTSSNGGVLKKFSSGMLTSEEFEVRAFAIKNIGSISEPFQSEFGWHIVKLLERYPIRSFDEMKSEIVEMNKGQFKK